MNMEFRIKRGRTSPRRNQKSRFICHIKACNNRERARNFIQAVKKNTTKLLITALPLYWEAGGMKRSSDDGEPSGTAGVPMLGVLRKSSTN